MFLAHDIILFPDRQEKFIGNEDIQAFLTTWDSTAVKPLIQCKWEEGSPANVNLDLTPSTSYIHVHPYR